MQATVKLFGPAAQRIGRSELSITLDGESATCATLRQGLGQLEPALAGALRYGRFAVNYTYVDDQHQITGDEEIALITMISGG